MNNYKVTKTNAKAPTGKSSEVYPIKSKRDFNKMKKALHGRDQLLLMIGTAFGLRISDLLELRVGDLRGKTELRIQESKRGKKRVITFSDQIKKIARDLEGSDDDYIFVSRKGANKPISRVQAYRVLNDAAKRAGVDINIGTHSLRKTFGYRLYENGVNITRIMAILGHSSESDTLRYIGVTDDEIAEAYTAITI